jgi:hypothetical protein
MSYLVQYAVVPPPRAAPDEALAWTSILSSTARSSTAALA